MGSIVVAISNNQVMGKDNEMPWYLPADLKHFKTITMGGTVVMGKITYESILKKLSGPLPGRRNIVLSTSLETVANGFELYRTLNELIEGKKINLDKTHFYWWYQYF